MASQHRYIVCLLEDRYNPDCIPVYVQEGAYVLDLEDAILRSRHWCGGKDEPLKLYKCGDLGVGGQGDRYARVLHWFSEREYQNLEMTLSDRLKEYFAEGPAPEEEKKIDIIAVTQSMLDTIPAQSVHKETGLLRSKQDNKYREEVTFKIWYRYCHTVDWIGVGVLNDFNLVHGDVLPLFIKEIVERPRCVKQVDDEQTNNLTKALTQTIGAVQSDTKLLSDAKDALPFEKPFHELKHFLKAVDWASYQKSISHCPEIIESHPFTLLQAYGVVFGEFEQYWHMHVQEGECQSNEPFPFPLIVDKFGGPKKPAQPPACSSADPNKRKYTPRPDVAFLKRGFPRFLVEFHSQSELQRICGLHVQLACALRLAAAWRHAAGYKDNNFFLMGALFDSRRQVIRRYFCYIDENNKISFHERYFYMNSAAEFMLFLFEFYNYARYIKCERIDALGDTKKLILALHEDISNNIKRSIHTGPDGGHVDVDATRRAVVISALRERHYKMPYNEEKEEWVSFHLPADVMEVIAPTEKLVMAKLSRRHSSELSLLRELSSHKSSHNHVIPLVDSIPSSLGQVIILPLLTPLSTHAIPNLFRDSLQGFVKLSRELIEGIAFLHRHKIAHLDIKPDNLVFDFESNRLYIIDFDIAMQCKDVEEMVEMSCGTHGWMAPEIVYDDNEPLRAFSPIRADLWACGKVLGHFAKETDGKDMVITPLTDLLMESEPRRRPLLHELVDESPDFWTSGRLSQTLESRVHVDKVVGATPEGRSEQKRECVDDNDGPEMKKIRMNYLVGAS